MHNPTINRQSGWLFRLLYLYRGLEDKSVREQQDEDVLKSGFGSGHLWLVQ